MKNNIKINLNFIKAIFLKRSLVVKVILVFLLSFVSCTDFLEEKPITAYSADQFYDSTEKLNSAVLGIYDVLSSRELFGTNIVLLGADTDIEILRGTTVNGAAGTIEEVGHYNTQNKSTIVESLWAKFYDAVNRSNAVISNASKMPSSNADEQKRIKKYIAEAKALRAFLYTNIVISWGDAPLRTVASDLSQNLSLERSPKSKIYAQIVKDFEDAIPDLPWHDDVNADKGRINKGAAMALYTRALLFAGGYSLYQDGTVKRADNYLEYYEKAEIISKELISSGKHVLNPSYENIFRNLCGNIIEPSESMFEIDFGYLAGQGSHAGTIGGSSTGVAIAGHSASYNVAPKMFTHYYMYNKFGVNDLRRRVSIADYKLNGPNFTEVPISVKSSSTWSCAKWRRNWHTSVPTNFTLTDVNYVVIRYSEVLLMRAEILNELNNGPTPESIELVNKVRRRGYGTNNIGTNADVPLNFTTDYTTFLNFITEEYAREFYGEGNRKFHLIRWNLLGKRIAEMAAIFGDPATKDFHGLRVYLAGNLFTAGKHELYPIPYRDIVESNGALIQNPGYSDF
ncbi:RagB/SusD family nutrient uptake outer membrane protein [Flavobacterium sp. JAS]|uniref:RagB/SusD family nutrient uptake outer membrane protein n=1 Tax=Flavobacterium sp. JAS TaxID=2897329 RepID=UPI001E414EA2|nr:RagB/SusD family nutrient uptake outer membrane protein [Flavobacterium sp. JAS]MCD0472359.1 RagB/SusD family nutrient uptake outer membrane protein [Flavobacterium sp. JAS]